MRVVQINSYSNGSTGQIAQSIHRALLSMGHESLLAYGFGPEINEGGYRISNKVDFKLHTAVTLLTGLHGYSSIITTRRLIRRIKKFKPDIVHLHNLHGGYVNINMLMRYLTKCNVKMVVTIHDCWLYTGKCYHYYEAACNRFLSNCGHCPQLSMYPKSYCFDFTSKMLKDKRRIFQKIKNLNVVTVSDWLNDEVSATFLGRFPIRTIKNGINAIFGHNGRENRKEVYKNLKGSFIILGVASSWNPHKGIDDFIALAQKLDSDEQIVLVGDVKNPDVLPANITTINRTESLGELADMYDGASVYVSMSTEETFGMTIAEALSCGVPAIVYDATACSEMIIAGENGYIAEPHNISQVYEYIQLIKQGRIGAKLRISEKARTMYSTERMVRDYLAMYEEI